jgi:hypothetical protein
MEISVMTHNTFHFPLFRKYHDGQTLFRIESEEEFTEIRRMGKYFSRMRYFAKNYADRLLISDMIQLNQEQFAESDQKEFEDILQFWESTLQPYPTIDF